MNKSIKNKFLYYIVNIYTEIIDIKEKLYIKYDILKKKYNEMFYKDNLYSIEFIDLDSKQITNIKFKKLNNEVIKLYNNLYNYNLIGIYNLNYCNSKGNIISYIITKKQFYILTKKKNFIQISQLKNLINKHNDNEHINILHSGINNLEITNLTKKYIKSLHNITVDNFIKFLKIKNLIYIDTYNSDLIIMDSDLLDEYIFKYKELITLQK